MKTAIAVHKPGHQVPRRVLATAQLLSPVPLTLSASLPWVGTSPLPTPLPRLGTSPTPHHLAASAPLTAPAAGPAAWGTS